MVQSARVILERREKTVAFVVLAACVDGNTWPKIRDAGAIILWKLSTGKRQGRALAMSGREAVRRVVWASGPEVECQISIYAPPSCQVLVRHELGQLGRRGTHSSGRKYLLMSPYPCRR